MDFNWAIVNTLATVVSTGAYIVTALYIRAELKALDKERYLAVTSELFSLWQGKEFMDAQLWLLHRLEATTWEDFIKTHRGDVGEAAFHRVGSFYDRVGTLVRLGLVNDKEILSTVGAYAIAVWQKIEPLVREARRVENSVLFDDFEMLLPSCYECYVPALGKDADVRPFSLAQPRKGVGPGTDSSAATKAGPRVWSRAGSTNARTTLKDLKRSLDRNDPVTVLDVRQPAQVSLVPQALPHAIRMPIGEVEERYGELPPGQEIVVYCA